MLIWFWLNNLCIITIFVHYNFEIHRIHFGPLNCDKIKNTSSHRNYDKSESLLFVNSFENLNNCLLGQLIRKRHTPHFLLHRNHHILIPRCILYLNQKESLWFYKILGNTALSCMPNTIISYVIFCYPTESSYFFAHFWMYFATYTGAYSP